MFSSSTQLRYWTFSGNTELNHLRRETNTKYIQTHGHNVPPETRDEHFLTPSEELKICRNYHYVLYEFCSKFQPPMPKNILGTAMQIFKRFYLHNSVMDYHPRDIVYTSVYLACKIEEFYVTIHEFVANLSGDREKSANVILSNELLLMHELHYHLAIHNPFRPLEGLFIDIKTRHPEMGNVEKLRPAAAEFLDRSWNSDVCLVFSPSQIALAAILSSANKNAVMLDGYVANKLLHTGGRETLMKTIEHVKRIKSMVKNIESLDVEEINTLKVKLEKCRNQANNPDSEEYKRLQEEQWDEEEHRQAKKRRKIAEAEEQENRELLGL